MIVEFDCTALGLLCFTREAQPALNAVVANINLKVVYMIGGIQAEYVTENITVSAMCESSLPFAVPTGVHSLCFYPSDFRADGLVVPSV